MQKFSQLSRNDFTQSVHDPCLRWKVPRGEDEEENGPLEEGIVDDVVHHLSPVVPSPLQGGALQTRGPAEPVIDGPLDN